MKTETISIKVNYSAAGLNSDGLCPTLERYPIATTMSYKKTAVIICPGGGYEYVSEREAEPIAIKFASLGERKSKIVQIPFSFNKFHSSSFS